MEEEHEHGDTMLAHTNTRPESDSDVREEVAPEPLPTLTPGSVIPQTRLEIVQWLGQGGMGVVFEVRHLDIERRFAAKLLNVSKSVRRMRRFRREARTISQLGSPWIVEVFDFKELPDGRLMYLMELVGGHSLYDVLRDDGPMPLPRLIAFARQVCKGLHDAHESGFIHRDIKPENLVIGRDRNGREMIKIVDFGLAALREGPKESNTGGTPAYMSPEQCRGLDADVRADIYSLGVTLYELACGHLPFVGTDEKQLRSSHLDETPRPPSQIIEGGLPPGLDVVILRCLAKTPEERYDSAAALEAALIEVQLELGFCTAWDDLPVPPLADARMRARLDEGLTALRTAEQRAERRRVFVGLGLVGLVGLGAVFGWQAQERKQAAAVIEAEHQIERAVARAREAAARARWVYPTLDQPQAETAFGVVLELERYELPGADEAGQLLREEFAGTLVSLGDAYWGRDGGRGFAREFYAQALMFEPEHARAGERASLSARAVLELRERATDGAFESYELAAVEPLVSLAESDPRRRFEGLVASNRANYLSERVAADVDKLLGDLGEELPADFVRELIEPAPAAEPDTGELDGDGDGDGDGDEEADSDTDGPAFEEDSSAGMAGKSAAESAVASAKSAYNSGQDDKAERLFHQALSHDSSNVSALVGLHQLYFDRGQYRQALDYARRAAKRRPKRGDLHIFVGDSCYKVLDYKCARVHYQTAKELGDARAASRLEMVTDRVGGSH